jgi:hypothetical protein
MGQNVCHLNAFGRVVLQALAQQVQCGGSRLHRIRSRTGMREDAAELFCISPPQAAPVKELSLASLRIQVISEVGFEKLMAEEQLEEDHTCRCAAHSSNVLRWQCAGLATYTV